MPKPTDYDKTHLRNMAAIGTRIDRLFKKAAEEAARIGVSIKTPLPEDRIFSFDDYPQTQKQIERLLAALKESTEMTIADGVRREWRLSNAKNNSMVTDLFGERVKQMTDQQKNRYFTDNADALEAFLQRKTKGLNLSDRVWKYTDAFKTEIEMGLDLGIRSGRDADAMSRDLRDYLQHPDKLFRRVRDQHGLLRLSQAAKDYHPGQGVYRSSYKNARRLAATETNIAYRTNDYLRWQQMDFVVGIEIQLSNNHTILLQPGERTDDKSQQRADGSPKANAVRPLTDICDTLQGRYPKDFKFTGWHPHCRCRAITILKTEDEMAKDTERILAGKQPTKDSVNTVRDVPDAFKQWVEKNTTRIENARNLPYFIQDNKKRVDGILGKFVAKTPAEAAAERHAKRDPEAIQKAWNERRIGNIQQAIADGYLPKEVMDGLSALSQEQLNERLAFLQQRAKTHAERDPKEVQSLKEAWAKRVKEHERIKRNADRVLALAKTWSEVDYSALEKLIAEGKLTGMEAETRKVMDALKAMRAEEKALQDLIPDVHGWHKQFSLAELKTVHKSIQDKLADFKAKGWGDFDTKTNPAHLKKSLEWQANYMATKGQLKYKTWEVAQKSYLHLMDKAQDLIDWDNINTDIKALQGFKTKSKEFQELLDKAIAAQATGDKKTAQFYTYNAGLKKNALEAAKAKREAAKAAKSASTTEGAVHFADECFTEARRKAATIFANAMDAEYSDLFDEASRLYQAASVAFKEAAEDYTLASGYLTKWLRGMDGYLESSLSYAEKAERHTRALSAVIGQAKLKRDMWLFRDERAAFLQLKAGGFDPDKLQAQIEEYTRKITNRYKSRHRKMTAKLQKELDEKIAWFTDWRARQLVGKRGIDPSILSCGTHKNHHFSGTGGDNKYGIPKVRLEIYCPKGTQAMYAAPFNHYNGKVTSGKYWNGTSHTTSIHEAEIFLQRDTEFRIVEARWDAAQDRWFIKVEVLGHRARDFEMESTPRGYKAKFK